VALRFSSGSPFESQIGFCRAVRVDNRILVSGTAPLTPNGNSHAPGDPGAQAQRCLEIIVEAVESLGGRKSDVVRTRIFLTCTQDWEAVGAVHGEFFGLVRPTATCVVVSALLRPEWCVEIEAEAVIPKQLRVDECDILDRSWIEERCQKLFSGSTVVTWGIAHEPALLPGFVARQEGRQLQH
jgi:enamine deaminase RidA (YjgF/YER057c/UK114 family)